MGAIKFGSNGEWATSRMLFVQPQNIKTKKLEEFSSPGRMIVIYPEKYRSGDFVYPFPGWE